MVGVISSLMGLFVRFVMMLIGVFYCLVYCVVRRFFWWSVGVEGVFVFVGLIFVGWCLVVFGGCWVGFLVVGVGVVLVECGIMVGVVVRSWLGCVGVEGGAYCW